jgi:hypothetical protein
MKKVQLFSRMSENLYNMNAKEFLIQNGIDDIIVDVTDKKGRTINITNISELMERYAEQLSKQGVSNNEVAVCPDPQHHAMELGLNIKCPTCGGETTFLEPDKCMTIDCPNCIF